MVRIIIAGDYSPTNRIVDEIRSNNSRKIFHDVRKLNEKVDYSIVNFESTIADISDKPISKCGPNLHCSPIAVEAIRKAGFDMVTLANNHFYDFGDSGIKKSFIAFKSNSLDYVGAGLNLNEASKTFFKRIKNKLIAIINCCEHEFSIATNNHGGCNPLNPIQQYYAINKARKTADSVIVIVHGGSEHFQLPSLRMKETYRFFIDAGADAVINHHQHCYSGYEYYKGKPIFYGIGNFCFDKGPKVCDTWHEGYLVELMLDCDNISHILHPYIQCKDIPEVELITNTSLFNQKISELNNIISNDELLKSRIKSFYSDSQKAYQLILQPYNNRYLKSAWYRGLLPSFVSKHRILRAINYINCESHLDRLKSALFNNINNNIESNG